jgi:hypothetical protein
MIQLFDITMNDGSRHFGDLPQTVLWYELRDHIAHLSGAVITGFITDDVTEAWIDFTYLGHHFSVNDQYGDYWFFVDDPACPDDVLRDVLEHCKKRLG